MSMSEAQELPPSLEKGQISSKKDLEMNGHVL